MRKVYDLVIVGTGTAAMVAAMRVRAAGWSVAVIDFRPFGGTCALRGSDRLRLPHARTRRHRGAQHRLAGLDRIQAKLYRLCPGKTRTNVRREGHRNLSRTCAVYRPEHDAGG